MGAKPRREKKAMELGGREREREEEEKPPAFVFE